MNQRLLFTLEIRHIRWGSQGNREVGVQNLQFSSSNALKGCFVWGQPIDRTGMWMPLTPLFPKMFCAHKGMTIAVTHVCVIHWISGYISAPCPYFRLFTAWWQKQTGRRQMLFCSPTSGQLSAHLWPGNFLYILHYYQRVSLLVVTFFWGSVPSLVLLLTFLSRNLNLFLKNNTLDRQLSERKNSKIFKMSSFKSAIEIYCSTSMFFWTISTCSGSGFQLFRVPEIFLYAPSSIAEKRSWLTLFPFPLFFPLLQIYNL